jgi:hypothetical protein
MPYDGKMEQSIKDIFLPKMTMPRNKGELRVIFFKAGVLSAHQ